MNAPTPITAPEVCGLDTDLIAQLEEAAMAHFKLSNAPKSPQWQCKAHAHAWAGMVEAIQIAKANQNTALLREQLRGSVLLGVVKACRAKFEEYALSHYRKHTAEGDAKALTNQTMATLCDDAIHQVERP